MAGNIFPAVRRQLPQTLTPINWNNPITRGLAECLTGGIDHVNGIPLESRLNIGINRSGLLVSGQGSHRPNSDVSPVTVIGHHRITFDNSDYGGILYGFYYDGSDNSQFGMSFADGVIYWINRANSSIVTVIGSYTLGQDSVYGLTGVLGSGADATAYRDGVALGTPVPQSGSGVFVPDSRRVMSQASSNSGATGKSSSWFYRFTRVLSAREMALLSADPAQVFMPVQKRLFIPVSSAPAATFQSDLLTKHLVSSSVATQILLNAGLINKNSLSGSLIGISASFAASLLNKNNVTANLSTSVRLASALANKNTVTSALNASIAFAASLTNKNAITSALNTSIALASQLNNYNLIISNLAGTGATFGSSLNNKNEITSSLLSAINLASSHNNYNTIVSALTTQAAGLTSSLAARNLLVSDILTAVRLASSVSSKNDITAAFGTNAALFSSNLQNYNLISSILSSLSISLSSSIQSKSTIQSNLQTLIKLASALQSKSNIQSQLGALANAFASNLESKSKIESILQTAIRLSTLIESKNSITARFEVFDLGNSVRYAFVPNYSNLEYLGQEKDLALIMQALNLDFLMGE